MTYMEALEKTNRFMEESGIRAFCTEVCKGACCSREYGVPMDKKKCCSKISCSDKLPCVGYICGALQSHLRAIIPGLNGLLSGFWAFEEIISSAPVSRGSRKIHNAFFDVYTKKRVLHLEFPDKFNASEEIMKQIRTAMDVLLESPQSEASRKILKCFWH